ncbi:Aspartokinase 2, chloroplastic [Glycine soja]
MQVDSYLQPVHRVKLSFISPHYVPKIVKGETSFTCVMKFGGSSVASADRMKEVATLILSFPEERPIVVLSVVGKTTNKVLLKKVAFWFCYAVEKAVSCGVINVSSIEELCFIKDLHLRQEQ